ncbi:MAG: GNAT family N-acetyltransferase [Myxococcota bacterium]
MSSLEMRTLRPGEEGAFLDLMQAAFNERDLFARYFDFDELMGAGDTKVICDGDRILAGLQIFARRIRLRGEAVRLGGIGSVATHPDYERQGLASRLLRAAIVEMQERGMMLSLLFTGRTSFYERLDWVRIPYPVWACGDPGSTREGISRPMISEDLPVIQELYDRYNRGVDCTTWRNPTYWRGQLRFAGSPDEDFRVVEREGRVVAYARGIAVPISDLSHSIKRAMEYAREDDAAEELAELLVEMTPEARPLFVSVSGDSVLEEACRGRFGDHRCVEFPDQMWRVLDRGRLQTLAGASAAASDFELLERLVGGERCVFWPTDRF